MLTMTLHSPPHLPIQCVPRPTWWHRLSPSAFALQNLPACRCHAKLPASTAAMPSPQNSQSEAKRPSQPNFQPVLPRACSTVAPLL